MDGEGLEGVEEPFGRGALAGVPVGPVVDGVDESFDAGELLVGEVGDERGRSGGAVL